MEETDEIRSPIRLLLAGKSDEYLNVNPFQANEEWMDQAEPISCKRVPSDAKEMRPGDKKMTPAKEKFEMKKENMKNVDSEKTDLLALIKQTKGKSMSQETKDLLYSKIKARQMKFKPRPVNIQTSKKELKEYLAVFEKKPRLKNLPEITPKMSHALRFWLAVKTFNRMNEVRSGSAKFSEFAKHFDLEARVIKRGLNSKKPKHYGYLSPGEFNSISLPLILVNYGTKKSIKKYIEKA